jgi:hypothetical protein
MPERIVVSFRGAVPGDEAAGARYLERALAMKTRAEAHGATLCAWSAMTFSFCFEPDELEEAVALATVVFDDDETGLCAGIAEGELAPVGGRGSVAGLSWGMPLVHATALSRAARAGEVLAHEAFFTRHRVDITALGLRGEGDPIKRLVPVLPAEEHAEDAGPSLPLVVEAPEPLPPVSLRAPDPVVESAKRALLQGDVAALEQLIAELRESGEHADLVERMSGFVALRRGATADALRRLRAAVEAAREPKQRARARLAYGVALAGAGRTESALLEALLALARARESADLHGEHACALFLARLSAASGHADAASVWAMVAASAEAAQ